jgi:RimJ/RimL family protein N-acetyltransferase
MADPTRVRAPAFLVRPARPRDAVSFLEMWRIVVAEGVYVRTDDVRRTAGEYRRIFRRPPRADVAQFLAVDGRRVIGQLFIQREPAPVTRHVATLGMAVAPDRRGQGVGTALMEAAIGWATLTGVEKLELSVFPDNARAQRLYRRFGFVEEGRLAGHSKKRAGYFDEILMGLWIGSQRNK